MIHAYNESYVNSAKMVLADCFDYMINDCKLDADWAASVFVTSGYAEYFEHGNPAYVAGMSGLELARLILDATHVLSEYPQRSRREGRSPEYWAGYLLTEYQWYSCHSFKEIWRYIPMREIISMYPVYHEMDTTNFIEAMDELHKMRKTTTNLKRIREGRGMSQSELSRESGINLRNIQMYEQRVNNIDRAQANIIYKLARVLGCKMEDLVESPSL